MTDSFAVVPIPAFERLDARLAECASENTAVRPMDRVEDKARVCFGCANYTNVALAKIAS